jgi:hypothetical protein
LAGNNGRGKAERSKKQTVCLEAMGKNVERARVIIRMVDLSTRTISLITEGLEMMTGGVMDARDRAKETRHSLSLFLGSADVADGLLASSTVGSAPSSVSSTIASSRLGEFRGIVVEADFPLPPEAKPGVMGTSPTSNSLLSSLTTPIVRPLVLARVPTLLALLREGEIQPELLFPMTESPGDQIDLTPSRPVGTPDTECRLDDLASATGEMERPRSAAVLENRDLFIGAVMGIDRVTGETA